MLLTDYTSFDEVRAALGVEVEELDDSTLELTLYADVLQVELEEVDIGLPATYDAVQAQSSQSEEDLRFLQAAHLFATYAVAKHLGTTLPLFSPEQVTDGKSAMRRSQDTPYQKVIDAVGREYARFRGRLEQAYGVINSSTAAPRVAKTYFGVVTPASDPITGT